MVKGAMFKVIEGFHHQASINIVGKTARCAVNGEWECPPASDALEIASLSPIKDCIQRLQATIVAHIHCQTIYELCVGAENIPGSSRLVCHTS